MISAIKLKYEEFKDKWFVFLWKIRIELDYRFWVFTRNFGGRFDEKGRDCN